METTRPDRERIGFVGLGHLGRPMAERAAAHGFLDAAWQRTERPTPALQRFGVTIHRSLRDLAQDVDIVSLCVRDEPDVIDVLDAGLLEGLADRGLVVVHSTVLPDACERLAEACERRGVSLIDAPVCGGPSFAASGQLLVSVGGEGDDVERAWPLLECYGGLVRHVGPLGAGQRVKLLMNLLYAANVEIVCQALELAPQVGLSEDVLSEFVSALPYRGFVGSTLATGAVGPANVEHGREVLRKDIRYAESMVGGGPGRELLSLGAEALSSLENAVARAHRRSTDTSAP